jgi:uncharacterized protein (DUF608 family)
MPCEVKNCWRDLQLKLIIAGNFIAKKPTSPISFFGRIQAMQRHLFLLMLVLVTNSFAGFSHGEPSDIPAKGLPKSADPSRRYFPSGVLHATWQAFPVQGYAQPITGVVYRGNPRPTCGMPLGGLDTGCLDIEPNGFLGYSTIFNQLVNPRLLYNVPFIGLSIDGHTCVLATDIRAKKQRPVHNETGVFPPVDYTPTYFDLSMPGVRLANSIDYFGHYPILEMEFDTDLPVHIGMRAWSPFLPGDEVTSMLPGAAFEFTLRNPTKETHRGTLVFSFPGFESPLEAKGLPHSRRKLSGKARGIEVTTKAKGTSAEMGYVLATLDDAKFRSGAGLGTNAAAWNAIERELPADNEKDSGATLAIDFELAPGECVTRHIILAWHAPQWNASGIPGSPSGREFVHMYSKRYSSGDDAAQKLATEHESLLRRVIAWQEEVYGTKQMPGWLADCLINNLHLITETGVWAQGSRPLATSARTACSACVNAHGAVLRSSAFLAVFTATCRSFISFRQRH